MSPLRGKRKTEYNREWQRQHRYGGGGLSTPMREALRIMEATGKLNALQQHPGVSQPFGTGFALVERGRARYDPETSTFYPRETGGFGTDPPRA